MWALIESQGGPFVEAPLGCYQYLVIKQHELSTITIKQAITVKNHPDQPLSSMDKSSPIHKMTVNLLEMFT